MIGSALGPEEVDLRSQRQNEVVVRQRLQFIELDRARPEIDARDVRLVDGRVVLPVDEVAQ